MTLIEKLTELKACDDSIAWVKENNYTELPEQIKGGKVKSYACTIFCETDNK